MGHTDNKSHRMLQLDWCSDGIGRWRHKIAGDWGRPIHRLWMRRGASAHECARFDLPRVQRSANQGLPWRATMG